MFFGQFPAERGQAAAQSGGDQFLQGPFQAMRRFIKHDRAWLLPKFRQAGLPQFALRGQKSFKRVTVCFQARTGQSRNCGAGTRNHQNWQAGGHTFGDQRAPGSLMQGMPASDTSAIVWPPGVFPSTRRPRSLVVFVILISG